MADIRATLKKLFMQIAKKDRILVRKSIEITRDPVMFWDYGRALTAAIPSSLYLLPFRVVRNDDGRLLLTVRISKWLRGISYILNAIIALRLEFFTSICLDPNFQWNFNGKFTTNAIRFFITILLGILDYLIHSTLFYSAEDFVFLYNNLMRLNRSFQVVSKHHFLKDSFEFTRPFYSEALEHDGVDICY